MIEKFTPIAIYLHISLKITYQVFKPVFYNKRENHLKRCAVFSGKVIYVIHMVAFGGCQVSIFVHAEKLSVPFINPELPKFLPIFSKFFSFFRFLHFFLVKTSIPPHLLKVKILFVFLFLFYIPFQKLFFKL